ncbi:hypothetical protein FQZ97_1054260 [compost metagenome]
MQETFPIGGQAIAQFPGHMASGMDHAPRVPRHQTTVAVDDRRHPLLVDLLLVDDALEFVRHHRQGEVEHGAPVAQHGLHQRGVVDPEVFVLTQRQDLGRVGQPHHGRGCQGAGQFAGSQPGIDVHAIGAAHLQPALHAGDRAARLFVECAQCGGRNVGRGVQHARERQAAYHA